MNVDHNNGNADQTKIVDDANQEKVEDQVNYSSYSRVVGKKKKLQSDLSDMQSRLNALEDEKLESTGQKDELISKLRQDLGTQREELKTTKSDYAWQSVSSSIKDEAVKQGCTDTNALINLLGSERMNGLMEHVGQDFKVEGNALQEVIGSMKTDYSHLKLFDDGQVNHHVAKIGKYKKTEAPGIESMSKEELKAHASSLASQGLLE